jgi:hypothetical protein
LAEARFADVSHFALQVRLKACCRRLFESKHGLISQRQMVICRYDLLKLVTHAILSSLGQPGREANAPANDNQTCANAASSRP